MIVHNINDNKVKFLSVKFDGKKSIEYYQNQIYNTLSKIGITKEFVEIEFNDSGDVDSNEVSFAQARWWINKQEFVFRCESQANATLNLGAISQAIQEDIRQVTRGIKDLFMIMNQYMVIDGAKKMRKTNLLAFSSDSNDVSEEFQVDELSLLKLEDGEVLAKEYEYLREISNDRINILYLNLKEQCLKQNKRDHPLLRALMVVRRDRGLQD